MKIAVVALGKIGLPLAVQFASKGHEVVGVDVNATVVDLVNAGTEPFPGEAHLQEKLSSTVADGRLRATTDYGDAVPGADAVVLVTEWGEFKELDFAEVASAITKGRAAAWAACCTRTAATSARRTAATTRWARRSASPWISIPWAKVRTPAWWTP